MNTHASSPTSIKLPRGAHTLFALLKKLRVGTLHVQLPDGTETCFGKGTNTGTNAGTSSAPTATIHLREWDVCTDILKGGDIGFAEGFIAGRWTTQDLPTLLKLMLVNRDAIESLIYGRWWGALLYRLRHLLRRNSKRGSRRNIHAHYDLGNSFYRLWLDETMNYSSALFEGHTASTSTEAQWRKVDRALRECDIKPGDRVLEIGCGWGALAERAIVNLGAKVTGLTLSKEQLQYAQQRLQHLGVADCADLRLQDYRDINEQHFDAVVSIEMFEAVGREYWGRWFANVYHHLKPGGKACVQTIVIRDDLFERYVRSTDFIQQYIFPGGLLPSASIFRDEVRRAGFEITNELAFGPDYAETLRRWRRAFLEQENEVRKLGFDQRFMHIWEFYLAYCEAAFDTGNTNVVQFTLQRHINER